MKTANQIWTSTSARAETAFWRAAVGATGLAVRHPRAARAVPLALLAAIAFTLGRAAGQLLGAL